MANDTSIKFIPTSEPVLDGNEEKYVVDAIRTNWISAGGPYTKRLEEKFAEWLGVKYAVACSSGTTAIHLAIVALGLKPGDEIIIPDFTIICSASMPILAGVKPVLVDVDKYWCMDPTKIEEKITAKTKAIMPVHMYGNPANLPEIIKIAKKYKLKVIEDACAAQGATVGNKKVGSIGNVGCFSFYASKNVTAGEGGMVVTNDEKVANLVRILRSQAFEKPRFIHRMLGFNYRMTDLQAAVALAQLENVDKKVAKRREIAENYSKLLAKQTDFELPSDPPWGKSTFWMYGLILKETLGRSRENIFGVLAEKGIGSERFYTPMSKQPVFLQETDERYPDVSGKYPNSVKVGEKGFYIPSGLGLTLDDQKKVVKALLSLKIAGAELVNPSFTRIDDRGTFVEALNGETWNNISFGSMNKDAVMGNHYHKKTDVFFYVTKGSVEVKMIGVKNGKLKEKFILKQNEGVIFKTWYSHAIKFLEESNFVMGKSLKYDEKDPDTFKLAVN